MLYEELEQLERVVNQSFKTGKMKVKVTFIPMRPDELGPALSQGVGDFIAGGTVITPDRQKHFAFTVPIMTNVQHIIVTGPQLANAKNWDEIARPAFTLWGGAQSRGRVLVCRRLRARSPL